MPDGIATAIVRKDRRLGTAEAVNALFDITNHKTVVGLGNRGEDGILHRVDVLILIYIDSVVALGDFAGGICGCTVLIDQKAFSKTQYVSYSKTGDQACAEAAAKYIREKKPNLFFIQLDQIDHVGHGDGHNTPAYYAALPVVDKQVGILMQAVADAGIWDETVFVISSDHGGTGLLGGRSGVL